MREHLVPALIAIGIFVAGCGGESDPPAGDPATSGDPGPVHVHGLGVNPSDGALFIATHTGLFRLGDGESEPTRVADRYQDTMGFTVVGPDRFLGSGHPDAREDLPPFLGLIESGDAGESWEPVSLLGEADFHALEARGERVYGFGADWESRKSQFLVSSDGGESWDELASPESFLALAIHPLDANRIAGAGESGTHLSTNGGRDWRELDTAGGLVAWASPNELVRIDGEGSVSSSTDGDDWAELGDIGGQPAAFEAEQDGLYVALHDGSIKQSSDGGSSWKVHFQP